MESGKPDRVKAPKGMNRQEFLKRGGAALAGIAGGSMLAGFSPYTRSASAQLRWPGVRSYLDPMLGVSGPLPPGSYYPQAFYGIEDSMRFEMRSGAEVIPPLQPNETVIELRRQVGWDKRIELLRGGGFPTGIRLWGQYSSNCSIPGSTMRLCTPATLNPGPGVHRADTIVLSKPKAFGQWTYAYHIDPNQFWYKFGGNKLTICWMQDACRCGFGFLGQHYARVFRTSFELGDLQPTWRNTYDTIYGVTHESCEDVWSDDSLPQLPAHTGSRLLRYEGYANNTWPNRGALCYFRVFDVNLYIHPSTWLLYWIHPTTDLGRYVGVDLVCTNGETLRDSGAVDYFGRPMHPAAGHYLGNQGIPLNQWSYIMCHVGRWLAGRTIDKIYVPFDLPRHRWGTTAGVGWFNGYIDTIYLGETPAGQLGTAGPIIPTTYS